MSEQQQAGRQPRRSQPEIEQLVAEFEASGLPRGEFCQRRGLALGTLDGYRKRVRRWREEARGESRLLKVELCGRGQVAGSGRDSGLAVALAGGRRIEIGQGFDGNTLQQVVRVLEQI